MPLALNAFSEGLGQSRFPNPRLGRDQYHTPSTRFRLRPSLSQQRVLILAVDERGQLSRMQSLEPALHDAWPEHLIRMHRVRETLQLNGAKVAVFEEIPE